ncbi:MAG TPA: M23 family metallopeptidase, partial [Stenomitos sp.]
MRREIPQKVDAQVGFTCSNQSESLYRFGATLFRRTRSVSVLSVTLTATVLGMAIAQQQASAYSVQPSLLGTVSSFQQPDRLSTYTVAQGTDPVTPLGVDLQQDPSASIALQSTVWSASDSSNSAVVSAPIFSTTQSGLTMLPDDQSASPNSLNIVEDTTYSATPVTSILADSTTTQAVAPSTTSDVEVGVIHTVERGENLTEIADKYEVSPESIAATNRIQNLNIINVHEDLVIPTPILPVATAPLVVENLTANAQLAATETRLEVSPALLTPQSAPKATEPTSQSKKSSQQIASANATPMDTALEFDRPSTSNEVALRTPDAPSEQASSGSAEPLQPMIARRIDLLQPPALDLPPLNSADQFLPAIKTVQKFIWPARGVFTSGYGPRWGRMHRGIDIAAPVGTPVVAAASGIVVTAGWNDGGYGKLVEIRHPDGSLTLYAHNSRITTRVGAVV